jgi:hypothetical protein
MSCRAYSLITVSSIAISFVDVRHRGRCRREKWSELGRQADRWDGLAVVRVAFLVEFCFDDFGRQLAEARSPADVAEGVRPFDLDGPHAWLCVMALTDEQLRVEPAPAGI